MPVSPDLSALSSGAQLCVEPLPGAPPLLSLLDAAAFRVHDVSAFPLVRVRAHAAEAGFAFAWRAELQRLVARAEPFVLVDEALVRVGRSDDTRMCAHWLRVNRAALVATCGGMIVVEPDVALRIATRQAGLALTAGTGLRIIVVSNARVARDLVPVLLKMRGNAPHTPHLPQAGARGLLALRRARRERR